MQNTEKEKPEDYKSILVIVAGFLVLAFFAKKKVVLMDIALGVALISLLHGLGAHYINWLWTKAGFVLGWVNSKILLGAIFLVFLVPIAALRKVFKKKGAVNANSFYETRNHLFNAEDLSKKW